jgi:hypothetical protein
LTANTVEEVETVNGILAFQELTTIPTGHSFVYLRNAHGGYLYAFPEGKVESHCDPLI